LEEVARNFESLTEAQQKKCYEGLGFLGRNDWFLKFKKEMETKRPPTLVNRCAAANNTIILETAVGPRQ
jgi:hypothetical protein